MVLLTNAVNANSSTSARLLTSTNVNDLSFIELTGIKAIVQDNIIDDNSVSTLDLPTNAELAGTLGNSNFDVKSHNMINQSAFGTQVHMIQSLYDTTNTTSVATSADIGPFTGDQVIVTDSSFPLVPGQVTVNVTSSLDSNPNEVYNLTAAGASAADSNYSVTLTGSNSDNVAQKIALSSTYNSVSASTLFETREDPSNSTLITNNASDFTVAMNNNTLYSQVESDNAFGTYTLTTSQNTSNLDHTSTSVRSMLDSNGTLPDTAFTSANTNMNNTSTPVSSYFLPSSLLNHSSLAGETTLVYDLCMQLITSGDVNIASNNAGFAIKSSVKTDLVDNTAFMAALANNNSNKFANDESSITYAITNGVVGFGAAKASSVSDANNSTFSASLSTSQEELLTSNITGSLSFVKDEINARASRSNPNPSTVFTGLNVYFGNNEAVGGSGILDSAGLNAFDVSYSLSLVMPDVSNTNYNSASNIVTNGTVTSNNNNVIVLKDNNSVLLNASDIIASDVNMDSFMQESDADVAMIKGTFQDVFADKTNVVDVLNAQGNTASSFTNEQFNLSITGTNVNLETINTSYDRLQLKMLAKSLNDLNSNHGLVLSNSAYEITNNANSADATTPIVLQQTADSLLDAGFAELYNTNIHPTDICLNMTLKVVPTLAGKKFGSYILQEIDSSYSNITTHQKQIFPAANDISLNSSTTSTENVSVSGLSNNAYTVTKTTTVTNKDVTIDFELGLYQNLKMKLKGIVETDVEYKLFDGSLQLPDIDLSGVTVVGESQDLFDYVRSRTITYNGVSYIQPTTGSVSSGSANLTFELSKPLLNGLKGRIAGRNPNSLVFSSSESFTDLDAFYSTTNTITGFENDTDAQFTISLNVDDSVTLDNANGYRIIMDIKRGSVSAFSLSAKRFSKSEIVSNLSLTTAQDLFTLFNGSSGTSNNLPALSFNMVVDPSNVLTISTASGTIAKLTVNEKSLLADFMLVASKGSIYTASKNLDGTVTSLGNLTLLPSESSIKVDNGVVFDVNDADIPFPSSSTTTTWSLLRATYQVKFDATANSYDFNQRISSSSDLVVSDPSFQDITISAYRGITANVTHSIERTNGTVAFTLVNSASNSATTSSHNLLIGTEMGLSFNNSIGNTGITVTQSNNSRFSDASFNDVSGGNLIITPARYTITEIIKKGDNTLLDTTSVDLSNLALSNLTPTSFDSELLNFYARPISASETNNVTGGIFVPSKIGSDVSETLQVGSASYVTVVSHPSGSSQTINFDFNKGPHSLSNSPLILTRNTRSLGAATIVLSKPQQLVTYRKIRDSNGALLGKSISTSSNIVNETFDINANGTFTLTDAAITLAVPVASKSLFAYQTVNSNTYKIDFINHASKISSVYIDADESTIARESIISTETSIIDLASGGNNTFLISHNQNPALSTGGSYFDARDVSFSVANNIFITLPHAFVDRGAYTITLPIFNGITTSIVGADYTYDASFNPSIKLVKYTSAVRSSFNEFELNLDAFRAIPFVASKIEEATINIPAPTFTDSTPFNFQTDLSNLAQSLSSVSFTEVSFNDVSNNTAFEYLGSARLNYVLGSLDRVGRGNWLELLNPHPAMPVKTLIVETPDVSRILSGDGAPIFRLRANGTMDTTVVRSQPTGSGVGGRTFVPVNPSSGYNMVAEYVAYNALDTGYRENFA